MFPDRSTPLFSTADLLATGARARALDEWRDAAELVWTRWHAFLEAEPPARRWAFAAYVAALDAESAAAGTVASVPTARAA